MPEQKKTDLAKIYGEISKEELESYQPTTQAMIAWKENGKEGIRAHIRRMQEQNKQKAEAEAKTIPQL